MKKTAVEWLIKEVELISNSKGIPREETIELYNHAIQQAKEMEKEQMIEAWMATDNPLQRMSAEQYYNETYGKNEEAN
jgi:hypothetical protein